MKEYKEIDVKELEKRLNKALENYERAREELEEIIKLIKDDPVCAMIRQT